MVMSKKTLLRPDIFKVGVLEDGEGMDEFDGRKKKREILSKARSDYVSRTKPQRFPFLL